MPFIMPSGDQIQIDFFNVINNSNIVAEYFHEGIMLATQTMPIETASIYSTVFSNGISGTHCVAANENITFELSINNQKIFIEADAFSTEHDILRIKINYLLKNKIVFSQRTSIQTLQSIAEEIRSKIDL
jgi:hypothetical protein